MPTRSLIGAPKTAVDTPALLVDLDVMESNIGRVAETCRINGIGWRPHTKGQKTPEIIQKELAAGAIGVTCAKLGEAEVLAAMGIRDILIANQIVGPAKMRRLVDLLVIADPIVGIDSTAHVDELGAALHGAGHTLRVVIEVDIGMHRAGVQPGTPVVALARAIAAQPGLRFVGVMGWESHAVTIAEPSEKARVVTAAIALLTSSAECEPIQRDPPTPPLLPFPPSSLLTSPAELPACRWTSSAAAALAHCPIARSSRASPRSRRAARSSATCTTARTITWTSPRHSPCWRRSPAVRLPRTSSSTLARRR